MTTLSGWMTREGLSPEEAAERIGCDRSTLVRILPGRDGSPPKRKPGWKLLRKIRAGTNGEVTANDFMSDDPDPTLGNAGAAAVPSDVQGDGGHAVIRAPHKERAA